MISKQKVNTNTYDSVVIGGGPSGLFCALELTKNGQQVALLEKGGNMFNSLCPKVREKIPHLSIEFADRFRSQCSRCNCLEGIGGAAFHFDSNLGYIKGLSCSKVEQQSDGTVQKYSTLGRAFGDLKEAKQLVKEVYDLFYEHGLPHHTVQANHEKSILKEQKVFPYIDIEESLPVDLKTALSVIQNIEQKLLALDTDIFCHSRAEVIERGQNKRWRVTISDLKKESCFDIEADNIIIGAGKSALPWILKVLDKVGILYEDNRRVDIGIRIETLRKDMAEITNACHNPKLTFLSNNGESVRTFCVCDGGRLMQYQMAGVTILDGQHCIKAPTNNTNFGVLSTISLPEGTNGTEYALNFARLVNVLGKGRPLVQRLSDFIKERPTTSLINNEVQTSLTSYTLGNLNKCLPASLISHIRHMISCINDVSSGSIQHYSLLTAPVIERLYPSIQLSTKMETSKKGIYLIGDSSSKVMGITFGAASGLRAARAIID